MSDKTIKSVRRIFEILELFDKERRPLAAKDVSKKLKYPLVSSHALLKSMAELGYADFDPPTWSYIPSRNFIALLDWVPDLLERERTLLEFVDALNQQTLETVNVSRRVNTQIRIMHGLESIHSVGVNVRVGAMMPITGSLTGLTALGGMATDDRTDYLERLRRNDPEQAKNFEEGSLDHVVEQLEKLGTATQADVFISGVGAVCFPVFTRDRREQLVIGVVGPTDRIFSNASNYRQTIKDLVTEFGIETIHAMK